MEGIGKTGEKEFVEFAENTLGWGIRESSRKEDMFDHIDFWLDIEGQEFSVDVKGFKNSTRNGLILVELLNVRGDLGWLYGKADFIAFKTYDDWLMVDRLELVNLVHRKMKIDSVSDLIEENRAYANNCMAPKWWRRKSRKDAITNILLTEVEKM